MCVTVYIHVHDSCVVVSVTTWVNECVCGYVCGCVTVYICVWLSDMYSSVYECVCWGT